MNKTVPLEGWRIFFTDGSQPSTSEFGLNRVDNNQPLAYQIRMSITNLSLEQLKQAIAIKEEIAELESKLAKLFGGKALLATTPVAPARKARKGMSATGKARIVAAQKARWAKIKGAASAPAKAVPAAKPAQKVRRKMSAAGKARIIAAQKARWAKVKGAASAPAAAKPAPAADSVKPAKGKLSAEGRAKIVAAMKKRWAAKKK